MNYTSPMKVKLRTFVKNAPKWRVELRILVCGDRNWEDYNLILDTLYDLQVANDGRFDNTFVVIEGGAKGADKGAIWATGQLGCGLEHYPAQWKKYGKAAGIIRNQQMLDEGKPDLVLAFHDDIEHSKGTKDMVHRAKKAGIPVEVITHAANENP